MIISAKNKYYDVWATHPMIAPPVPDAPKTSSSSQTPWSMLTALTITRENTIAN